MSNQISDLIKTQLSLLGFKVKESSTKVGQYRWFRDTGGDGESVPPVECSTETFMDEFGAWNGALSEAKRMEMYSVQSF